MPEEKEEVIPTEFAQWYGRLEVGQNAERRSARWRGVLAVRDEADTDVIEALVRLAFGERYVAAAPARERIIASFRDADETFAADPRELQVLAGCALWHLLNNFDKDSARTGLSIQTASFVGFRKPELPMDLVGLASNAMDQMSMKVRQRPSLDGATSGYRMPDSFDKAVEKLASDLNHVTVKSVLDIVKASYSSLSQAHAKATLKLANFVKVQDEELQLLWWLTTGWSKLTETTLDSIPPDAQPIALAADIAAMTQVSPGLTTLEGLLHRAGLKNRKKVGFAAVLKACDAPWLNSLMPAAEVSPLTMPLHLALRRFEEAQRSEKCVSAWEAAVGLPEGTTALPLLLARQFYRERLLLAVG
jgi:hypothetical protein